MKKNERVLAVPTAILHEAGAFQGFRGDAEHYLRVFFDGGGARFLPREEAERDPAFKQLIPYVVLRHGGMVFAYTRGVSQGESRLHAKRSIGIGGHVDEADAEFGTSRDAYERAVFRELAEEVDVRSTGVMRCAGLINDDSTPVGQVHLGIVHVYDLDEAEVSPLEDGIQEAGFIPVSGVRSDWERFETWSRICVDALLDPIAD